MFNTNERSPAHAEPMAPLALITVTRPRSSQQQNSGRRIAAPPVPGDATSLVLPAHVYQRSATPTQYMRPIGLVRFTS